MVSIERRWKDYCELKQKKSELERNLGETLTKEIDKLDKQKGRVSGWTIFSGIVIGSYILKNYLFPLVFRGEMSPSEGDYAIYLLSGPLATIGLSLPIDTLIIEKYFERKISRLNREKNEDIQEYRKTRDLVKCYGKISP